MRVTQTQRGFQAVVHEVYPPKEPPQEERVVQQSSAIGEYDDSLDKPGSSYLWVGKDHHLNREEVAQLVKHLQHWLKTGQLIIENKE